MGKPYDPRLQTRRRPFTSKELIGTGVLMTILGALSLVGGSLWLWLLIPAGCVAIYVGRWESKRLGSRPERWFRASGNEEEP